MTDDTTSLVTTEDAAIMKQPPNSRGGWNFSLDAIRRDTAHLTSEEQETLVALFRWCIDPLHPMDIHAAASRLECSSQLIYQLLTGKYRNPDKTPKGPSDAFLKNARDFLATEQKRFAAVGTDFVVTPTAKKVFTACDLARESHSPVILWSTSHIGKTWALKYYQAHNNHGRTFMAELDAASGYGGMVRILAIACGISAKENTAGLLERIKRALTPNTVLIIDEMHLLKHTYQVKSFIKCVEAIRRIYDFTQCGMVLSWTNIDALKNSSQDELIQIWRRGVHRVALPVMPTKADLTTILQKRGLEFPDRHLEVTTGGVTEKPYEILRQLGKNSGLKSITERLRYANILANKKNGKIAWTNFVDAHLRIEKQGIAEGEWS